MMMQAARAFLALFLWGLATPPLLALTLVENGRSDARIVIAKQGTASAQLAAHELQYHLGRITGVTLPIVDDSMDYAGPVILVGESRLTRDRDLRSADFQSQEYLVRIEKKALILMGRDKEARGKVDYAKGEGFPEWRDEQGSCYAVYDFLERYAGVRWYLPTELGLVYSPNATFTVGEGEIRRSPAMRYRFLNIGYPYSETLDGDTVQAASYGPVLPGREQRLFYLRNRIGGENYQVSHSLYGYYDRFLEKNPKRPDAFERSRPEWFAKGYENVGKPPQMCYTNPEFIRQVVQDARDYFDGKGAKPGAVAGEQFALVPMDNDQWCKCAECRKFFQPQPKRGKGSFSNDRASNYFFSFVNKVAEQLKTTHPKARISVLAYHDYAYPPDAPKLEPNVDVTLCLHSRDWPAFPETKKNDMALVNDWRKNQNQTALYLWLYYCWPSLAATQGQWRTFPGFFAHSLVRQMEYFHQTGVRGIFYEPSYVAGSRQSALLDQLAFHVTWSLANDPSLDGNRLIADFFPRYYGKEAGAAMEKFYRKVEEIYGNPGNYPQGVKKIDAEISWGHLGTKARMEELEQFITEAQRAPASDIEKQRLALIVNGIWNYMKAGYDAYQQTASMPSQSVTVPRLRNAPEAGADLSALEWEKGGVLHQWRTIEGKASATRLEGRLLHDGVNLYIRLRDPVAPTKLADRGVIWNSDEYELFFSKEKQRPVRQIGIDFKGRHSGLVYTGEGIQEWKGAFRVLSDLGHPDRWTLYFSVPLADLTDDGISPGDVLYMNVVRSMRIQPQEAFVWNSAFGDYHKPRYFGKVTLEP